MMKLEIILTFLVYQGVWAIQLIKDNLDSTCVVTENEIQCDVKKIESVDQDAFVNYGDKIRKLSMRFNSISKLESGTFAALTKLDTLYLDNNQLATIPVDLFKPENSLTLVSLDGNSFEILDLNQFQNYPRISQIVLSHNLLTTIKSPTQKNSALVTLDLSFNQIESLGKGVFNNLVSLTSIYLVSNLVSSIHPEFISPENKVLSYIDLEGNKMQSLDLSDFQNFNSLGTLKLASNEISSIVGTIPFIWLQRLDLSNNKLEIIQDGTFRKLSMLSSLQLNQNSLTKIPAVEIYCFKVKTLDLCGNQLEYIDQDNCNDSSRIFQVWKDKFGFNDDLTCPKSTTTTRSPSGDAAHVAPKLIFIIFMISLVSILLEYF